MTKIKLLDKETSEKIAAGEIIERPVSIVKELVENSIDAGSTSITVEIEDGGISCISVLDNGCGMTSGDLEMSIKRFATSKIQYFDDLEKIQTLGFRGEALPSIGAVSKLEIISCIENAAHGYRISVKGGNPSEIVESPAEKGTYIKVTDLFFNTPARKKFLKSSSQETAQISGFLSKIALLCYDKHIRFASSKKTIFNFPLQLNRRERLKYLWNIENNDDLLDINYTNDGLVIEGLICHPRLSRINRLEEITFVNKRLIKNQTLLQAILEGYGEYIVQKRFPQVLIFLQIPGENIDINVHPSKTEVRFADNNKIFRSVKDAIGMNVRKFKTGIYEITNVFNESDSIETNSGDTIKKRQIFYEAKTGEVINLIEEKISEFPEIKAVSNQACSFYPSQRASYGFTPLGQIQSMFIVGEMNGDLFLIDQHAAHERIIFDRLKLRDDRFINEQGLMFSEVFELNPQESLLLKENLALFEKIGINIEYFGGNSFILRTLPGFIDEYKAGEIIKEIISDLQEEKTRVIDDMEVALRKIVACRTSIQAGKKLSFQEMEVLMNDLLNTTDPLHCPHGRPAYIKLGKYELEKLFKRK